ncbi:MAG: symmetrical bis(5'-nucleosyl)-tetraphosphatase, partial [Burkholderiales bacterium]|nr:symmetrical bis(5'-nucleosyl)-tetraphosphatase [Burkholderiales bacterium]
RIWLLGDLVNRGPQSLRTLRRLRALGDAARCVLGNHDLHLLAVAAGGRRVHRQDTIDEVLAAPDREALLDWLRHQRMARQVHGWLLVHAGVVPQWDLALTLDLAAEVEDMLRSEALNGFLQIMYGDEPLRWDPSLEGARRLRFVINVLTRVRFVGRNDGALDLNTKEGAQGAPEGLVPWFDAPGRRTAGISVAFGHWSTLGLLQRPDLLALDTGCVWGGRLSAARLAADGAVEILQVPCLQAQAPGGVA